MADATWNPHAKHDSSLQSDLPDSAYAFPKPRTQPGGLSEGAPRRLPIQPLFDRSRLAVQRRDTVWSSSTRPSQAVLAFHPQLE